MKRVSLRRRTGRKNSRFTFIRTTCFSPAFTFLTTSSSVRLKQDLSYVAFDPVLANFSRVVASLSGEQKHRYA